MNEGKLFKCSMANLSMNLSGGLFDTNSDAHLRFLPQKDSELSHPWNGEEVAPEMYE